MIFGNWEVTSDSINWIGEPDSGYEIPINQLLELTGGEDEEFYDWLVHISQKTWIQDSDIDTLRDAFAFVAKRDNMPLDTDVFLDTILRVREIKRAKNYPDDFLTRIEKMRTKDLGTDES